MNYEDLKFYQNGVWSEIKIALHEYFFQEKFLWLYVFFF